MTRVPVGPRLGIALLLALLLPALVLAAGACDDDGVGPPERLEALPRSLTVAEEEVIRASNEFAFELLRQAVAREDPGANVFVSPLSVSMALGMTLNGADGETFQEMRRTLALEGMSNQQINEAYRGLVDLLLGLDSRVDMEIANSTWAREGFPFEPAFFETVGTYFDAEARELDFGDPGSKDVINGWVRDRTRGRIETIVDEIRPLDILFLINAVYFRGRWTYRFDPSLTALEPFQVAGENEPVQVETMVHQEVEAGFGTLPDGGRLGELPYGAQAYGMVVVLPPPDGSVADLVEDASAARWESWMGGLGITDGRVELPKLELEYEVQLNEHLKAMGMPRAFDPTRSDFARLTPVSDAHISRVKHKTFLRVDEEGTEAAAVTSVGVGVTSAPPSLVVDRPFLLAIRERLSGTILFLGVINDPR